MTIRDYLRVLRDRILIVAITISIVTLAAFGFSLRQKPQYTASNRLLLRQLAPGTEVGTVLNDVLKFRADILTEAELLKSRDVAERVARRLKLKVDPSDLIGRLTVLPYGNAAVLLVSANDENPVLARDLANFFAEEYLSIRREQAISAAEGGVERIAGRLATVQGQLDEVDAQLRTTKPDGAQFEILKHRRDQFIGLMAIYESQRQALLDEGPLKDGDLGQIIEYARTPKATSGPSHIRNIILGVIVGIPLALGIALLLDSMSDTIKSQDEANRLTGSEALALIPDDAEFRAPNDTYIASAVEPHSAVAEAYRGLRINLEFGDHPGRQVRRFLVTSPGPQEGKSVTAANLAVTFAEAGRRVTLIEADLRRPTLHRFFDVDREPGLSDLLREGLRLPDVLRMAAPNLLVLPSGTHEERPDRLLANSDINALISDIARMRQVGAAGNGKGRARNGHSNGSGNGNGNGIGGHNGKTKTNGARNGNGHGAAGPKILLFDGPSVLGAAEATSLAQAVDGVVLVIRVGVTRRLAASRAAEQVRKAGGKVIGFVLVGVPPESSYGSYSPTPRREARKLYAALTRALIGTTTR